MERKSWVSTYESLEDRCTKVELGIHKERMVGNVGNYNKAKEEGKPNPSGAIINLIL